MVMKHLIGIDLGTTAAKCAIYREDGTCAADATEEMTIRYPRSGEAEQDAMDFYTVSCRLIRECLTRSAVDPASIAGLAIDSQMGGIMSVDSRYRPVTYYDTPLDSRSAEENRWMHESFGDRILELNGSFSTFGNKILYWKKRNEWSDIASFLQPSAFVAGKLAGLAGGQAFMDETFLCFSGLADLQNSCWSEELCSRMQVDPGRLPRIVKSTDIIGETTREASRDTGLPAGIPIAAGCGDQTAGFAGAGILQTGQLVDVSGTACILGAYVDTYRVDAAHRTLATVKAAAGGGYYLITVVLGGRTHNWFIEEFFPEEAAAVRAAGGDIYRHLDEKARAVPPGSDGLVSINYLQGRFFPPDPSTRGLFIGHTWAHTRMHFYRSILESIAYDHYLAREIIRGLVPGTTLGEVTAIGSGAKSELWMQIKADVLQAAYRSLHRSDLSTLGAAILAGLATGIFSGPQEVARKLVSVKRRIEPTPGADAPYRKYIGVYDELFRALRDVYRRLGA
jgi:xylulokinase